MIPPSKYHSQWTVYKGIKYASKREAKHAAELDLLVRAGQIKSWRRQVGLPLIVNGKRITFYVIDFEVQHLDGTTEFQEVKGFSTDLFKIKYALFRALYPDTLIKIIR